MGTSSEKARRQQAIGGSKVRMTGAMVKFK